MNKRKRQTEKTNKIKKNSSWQEKEQKDIHNKLDSNQRNKDKNTIKVQGAQSAQGPQSDQTAASTTRAEEEKVKYRFTTVKSGLNKTIKNKAIVPILKKWVNTTSQILNIGSLVFNKYILNCVRKNYRLPDFSNWNSCSTDMLHIFTIMTIPTRKTKWEIKYDPHLIEIKEEFLEANIPLIQRNPHDQQIILSGAKQFFTNFQTYLVTTFMNKQKKFISYFLEQENLSNDDWFKYIWYTINRWEWNLNTPQPTLDQVPRKIIKFIQPHWRVLHWQDYVQAMENYNEAKQIYDVENAKFKLELKLYKKIKQNHEDGCMLPEPVGPKKPLEPAAFTSKLWIKQNVGIVLKYFRFILGYIEGHNDDLKALQPQLNNSETYLDSWRVFTLAPFFDIDTHFITIDQTMYKRLRNLIISEEKKQQKAKAKAISKPKHKRKKQKKINNAEEKADLIQNQSPGDRADDVKFEYESKVAIDAVSDKSVSDWSDLFNFDGLFTKSRQTRGFEFAHNIQTDGCTIAVKFKKKLFALTTKQECEDQNQENKYDHEIEIHKADKLELDQTMEDSLLVKKNVNQTNRKNIHKEIDTTIDRFDDDINIQEFQNMEEFKEQNNNMCSECAEEEQLPNIQKNQSIRVIAIDPGRVNIVYAVERINTDPNYKDRNSTKNLRIHKLTRNEYYRKSGADKASKLTHGWIKKDNMTEIFTELRSCSLKTIKQENWTNYLQTYSKYFDRLWAHKLQPKYSRLKFKKYICKNQFLDRFINSLSYIDGQKDYSGAKILIVYGDGSFASGGKGERSIPNKYMYDLICKRYETELGSEFRSTRICCCCHKQLMDIYAKRCTTVIDPNTNIETRVQMEDPPKCSKSKAGTKMETMEISATDTVDNNNNMVNKKKKVRKKKLTTEEKQKNKRNSRQCRYRSGQIRGLKWCSSTDCKFKFVHRDRNAALNILDRYYYEKTNTVPAIFRRNALRLDKKIGSIGLLDVVRGKLKSRMFLRPKRLGKV